MKKKVIITSIIIIIAILLGTGAYYIIKNNKEETKENTKNEVYSQEKQEALNETSNNSKFTGLKDITLEEYKVLDEKNNKDFNYDFDSDGKKEKLTIKDDFKNNEESNNYLLQLNGNTIDKSKYYSIVYIVDLNKNDNQLEVVILQVGESENSSYKIYAMKDNKMQIMKFEDEMDMISGSEFFTNQNGDFYVKNNLFSLITPDIAYYKYKIENGNIQIYKTDISDIADIRYSVTNNNELFFTEDINNADKFMQIVGDSESREEALNKSGMRYLDTKESFKILKFTEVNELFVELDNNVQGYIFGTDHISD